MRRAAQAIGALARHADGFRCGGDEAGVGEHDEAALLLLGPAVIAGAAADRHPAIVGGVVAGGRRGALLGGVGGGKLLARRGVGLGGGVG